MINRESTKEMVKAISYLKAGYTLGHADVSIMKELARIALASLEAEVIGNSVHDLFLRAKALMYQSGGSPIGHSLNPVDAWLFEAERAANKQDEPVSPYYKLQEEQQEVNGCWCHACRPVTMSDMRFVVCPDCGNKRCPKANNHRNSCTGSNEPGQEGSAYQEAPRP